MSDGVVMLASDGSATAIVYNALSPSVPVRKVIIEQSVTRVELLKRRAKKLGVRTVLGQVAFQGAVAPLLHWRAARRTRAILEANGLSTKPVPAELVAQVESANARSTIELLQELAPSVVVVQGTRILSKELLASVSATFINTHAGITPLYRGVHGGYWALAQSDAAHCGVTVHVVDTGIDTGGIIAQATIQPTPEDSYATYPLLQLAAAMPLLRAAVSEALEGRLVTRPAPVGTSRLYSHPTVGQYVFNRLTRGVR